jgi:helicase
MAENVLLDLLAVTIRDLAEAPAADELRGAVSRVLQAGGRLEHDRITRASAA